MNGGLYRGDRLVMPVGVKPCLAGPKGISLPRSPYGVRFKVPKACSPPWPAPA